MIKAKGIIVPVDWDDEGVAVSFALSTFDEDLYILCGDFSREEMMTLVRAEVEVGGELRLEDGKKTITVSRIRAKNKAVA